MESTGVRHTCPPTEITPGNRSLASPLRLRLAVNLQGRQEKRQEREREREREREIGTRSILSSCLWAGYLGCILEKREIVGGEFPST
jgi:hypothetical protein